MDQISKAFANFILMGASLLLVVGLTACEKPGPAESAGKKIDETLDKAGKKTGEATDTAGEKLSEQGTKAGVVIDDSAITAKVKAAILDEPGLKTLQISVTTVNGVVTLSGSVDSRSKSDRAKALVGAVAGVKTVQNRLVVTPPQ